MGEGSKYLDRSMQENMDALDRAKQSGTNVDKVAKKESQVAQISSK